MLNLLGVRLSAKLHLSVAFFDVKYFRHVQVAFCCDFVCLHQEKFEERVNCLVTHLKNLVRKKLDLLAQVELEVEKQG